MKLIEISSLVPAAIFLVRISIQLRCQHVILTYKLEQPNNSSAIFFSKFDFSHFWMLCLSIELNRFKASGKKSFIGSLNRFPKMIFVQIEKIWIFEISFSNTEMELKNVRISNYDKCNEMEVSRWSYFNCSFYNENEKDLQSFVCHLDESSSLNRDLVKPVHSGLFLFACLLRNVRVNLSHWKPKTSLVCMTAAIQTTPLCEREPSSCHVFAGKKKSSFQILIETIPSLDGKKFGAARAWILSWVTSIVHVLSHRWTLRIRSLPKEKYKTWFSLIVSRRNVLLAPLKH